MNAELDEESDLADVAAIQVMALAARCRMRVAVEVLAPEGLTSLSWEVMAYLAEHALYSPSEIAAALAVPRSSLTEVIVRLESAGLLRRRIDEEDRRRFELQLTMDGVSTFRRLSIRVREAESREFRALAVSELLRLNELLTGCGSRRRCL